MGEHCRAFYRNDVPVSLSDFSQMGQLSFTCHTHSTSKPKATQHIDHISDAKRNPASFETGLLFEWDFIIYFIKITRGKDHKEIQR